MLRRLLLCPQHVEKIDLGASVKVTDEAPWGSSHDPAVHFNLFVRNQEIKFKVGPLGGGVGLGGEPVSPSHPPLTHTSKESHRVSNTGLVIPGKSLDLSGPQFPQLQNGIICIKYPEQDTIHKDHHCHHSVFQQTLMSTYYAPDFPLVAQQWDRQLKIPAPEESTV